MDKVSTSDRVGAACGVAYVALILVGNGMATGNGQQSTDPTGQQVIQSTLPEPRDRPQQRLQHVHQAPGG